MHPNFIGGIHEKKRLNRNGNGLFGDIMRGQALKVFVSLLVAPDHGCISGSTVMTLTTLIGAGIDPDHHSPTLSEQPGRLRILSN